MKPLHSPLTPTTLHVMLALANGPQHGYAILKEAERLSDGGRPMGAGTLYAILKRLLEGGLIAESGVPSDTGDASDIGGPSNIGHSDGRRRYYELTEPGRDAARGELERLENVVRLGRARRLLEDHGDG